MSIFNHFNQINLSQDQKSTLNAIESFLKNQNQIFLLKGYAGSGKTTIVKGLVEYLIASNKEFFLMAPTGRAAKILRDKTGIGKTIHSSIYNFFALESKNIDKEDEAEHSFHYHFPISTSEINNKIIIVDEASMISATYSKNELFTFGTGNLLNDLLTFAGLKSSNSKIIFVGDPAQLPPVTDNKSLALDASYLTSLEYTVEDTEMKQVMRQDNNLILVNATKIRELLNTEKKSELRFNYDQTSFFKIRPSDIIEKFVELFPVPEIGNGVIISYSNAQCFHYNTAIRERIFPDKKEIEAGDLLLICNNNYHTYGLELYNGDFAKVVEVSSDVQLQSAPVQNKELNQKVNIQLKFRKIKLRVPSHNEDINCFILENLLHSVDRDLSIDEMKALYINFVMRFNSKQKQNKESGLNHFRVGSEEFRQELKNDLFYNALKVKFGYAITCHKAQGGEWEKVFVDYSGRISLKNDPLRWCYTATTRAISSLYAINPPDFKKLDKFKIIDIGNISTLPNEALNFDNVTLSPFHNKAQHKCKSDKYWEILEKLENTDFKIIKVETIGNYLERYTIGVDEKQMIIQASNRSSGHFVEEFKVVNSLGTKRELEIESIFNQKTDKIYLYNYQPENNLLSELHSTMQQFCNELGIIITNVFKGNQFFVNYYLITDSICSYIQFYYNNGGKLTTAMPKTFNCTNDEKLKSLILKLIEYAS